MASRTTLSILLFLFLFTVSKCAKKMTYVNAGHGCNRKPFSVKCNSDCIKAGYTGGICIRVFCVCLPDWDNKEDSKQFQREYDERIGFPIFGKD